MIGPGWGWAPGSRRDGSVGKHGWGGSSGGVEGKRGGRPTPHQNRTHTQQKTNAAARVKREAHTHTRNLSSGHGPSSRTRRGWGEEQGGSSALPRRHQLPLPSHTCERPNTHAPHTRIKHNRAGLARLGLLTRAPHHVRAHTHKQNTHTQNSDTHTRSLSPTARAKRFHSSSPASRARHAFLVLVSAAPSPPFFPPRAPPSRIDLPPPLIRERWAAQGT